MTRLIGFIGPAGCGKTTAAEALAPLSYRRVGFADQLKAIAAKAFAVIGSDWAQLWRAAEGGDREAKEILRPVLIGIGEAGRNICPTFWVDDLIAVLRPDALHAIDDVRYLNECIAIKRAGGVLVRIHRPGFPPTIPSEIASLTEIDAASVTDFTILNDADLLTLTARTLRIAGARTINLSEIERDNAAGRGSGSVVADVLIDALSGGAK